MESDVIWAYTEWRFPSALARLYYMSGAVDEILASGAPDPAPEPAPVPVPRPDPVATKTDVIVARLIPSASQIREYVSSAIREAVATDREGRASDAVRNAAPDVLEALEAMLKANTAEEMTYARQLAYGALRKAGRG